MDYLSTLALTQRGLSYRVLIMVLKYTYSLLCHAGSFAHRLTGPIGTATERTAITSSDIVDFLRFQKCVNVTFLCLFIQIFVLKFMVHPIFLA